MPCPVHAAIIGRGNVNILDSIFPLRVIPWINFISPDEIIFRSKPPENIPFNNN